MLGNGMSRSARRSATQSGTRATRSWKNGWKKTMRMKMKSTFQSSRILLDKGVVRRVYEYQVRFTNHEPPTRHQIDAVRLFKHFQASAAQVYITQETANDFKLSNNFTSQFPNIRDRFEKMVINLPGPYSGLQLRASCGNHAQRRGRPMCLPRWGLTPLIPSAATGADT